jgi:predicted metal-dependent hydrolase
VDIATWLKFKKRKYRQKIHQQNRRDGRENLRKDTIKDIDTSKKMLNLKNKNKNKILTQNIEEYSNALRRPILKVM